MTIDDYRQLLARMDTPWSPFANTKERVHAVFIEASKNLSVEDFTRLVNDVATGHVYPTIARTVAKSITLP